MEEFHKIMIRCAGYMDSDDVESSVSRHVEFHKTLVLDVKARWGGTDSPQFSPDTVAEQINKLFISEGKGDTKSELSNMRWEAQMNRMTSNEFNLAAKKFDKEGTLVDKFKLSVDWSFQETLRDDDEKMAANRALRVAVDALLKTFKKMMNIVDATYDQSLVEEAKTQKLLNDEVVKFFERYEKLCFTLERIDASTGTPEFMLLHDWREDKVMRVVFKTAIVAKVRMMGSFLLEPFLVSVVKKKKISY